METYSEHNMKTFLSHAVQQTTHSKTELQINYENQWEASSEELINDPTEQHNVQVIMGSMH